ncbi:MAG: sulfatase-like hydrolase/transferase [Acidobacteriota bacterium]|nr:MAG: sulfatase-like hydrolase/transferase [Acidobacteriota bacterium]
MSHRRLVASVANFGLLVFGLALLMVLGTGGTRLHLLGVEIGLRHVSNPLQGFAFFAALRLLAASRRSGLEARVVKLFARLGLPPRDAPATRGSAVQAGAGIGAGFGIVIAIADLTRLFLTAGHPGLDYRDALAALFVSLVSGGLAGAAIGALAGWASLEIGRRVQPRPGRYQAGRWCLALLAVLAPLVLRLAPAADAATRQPSVLLSVTSALLGAGVIVALVIPAAVLRARRGKWGLAVIGGGVLAVSLGLAVIAALGAPRGVRARTEITHPNILVITVSGLRIDALGMYRDSTTLAPAIQTLGFGGCYFLEATTPSGEVPAAAASLLSGLYPATHGLREGGDAWRWPPEGLPEILASHGYHTAGFVSWDELNGRQSGLAELFAHYRDLTSVRDRLSQLVTARGWVTVFGGRKSLQRPPDSVVADVRAWLDALPQGPWFAWVELAGPARARPVVSAHEPWPTDTGDATPGDEPALWWEALGAAPDADAPLPQPPAWADADRRQRSFADWLGGYEAAVRAADRATAELVELLQIRGERHRTLVVVTAEQATSLGEDGHWFEAGTGVGAGFTHVPWLINGPAVPANGIIPGPCSLVDVAPTLLGLVGLGGTRRWEGEDLSRYVVTGAGALRDPRSGPVFIESLPDARHAGRRIHAVRLGPWKLVRYPGGGERLYFVEGPLEGEVEVRGGRVSRQHQSLSDILANRLAEQTQLTPSGS